MKTLDSLIRPARLAPVMLLLGSALVLPAQEEEAPQHGRLEIGIRQMAGDRSSAKFNEYRHIPNGFFLQYFEMKLDDVFKKNSFLSFQTRETLEKDQGYRLGAGEYGKYGFEFRWDRTPHVFTNSASTFFRQSAPGVYALPDPTRTLLQTTPANLPSLLDGAQPLDVSLARKQGSGGFTYTPKAEWILQWQYSREDQTGVRPFGTSTNSFTNAIELPEPIDYRTHEAKATVEYGNQTGGFQAGYTASIFSNEISDLVWDNPFRVADASGTGARGRMDLYPDNVQHTLGFAGAVNVGDSTRLMGSVSPSWVRQNDPFLPFTINRAVTGVPALPAASLQGARQRLAMNYVLASNPLPALALTARYRSFDYNNDTPSLLFSDYVRTDANLTGVPRRNLPYGYNRQNLSMEASWTLHRGQVVNLGYEWEGFDREHRDVVRSNEHTAGASLDISPRKWVLFRSSYKHSLRRPGHYEANEDSLPLGPGEFGLGQLHELRKFDQAGRDRDRAEALVQVDAGDSWSFSAAYGTTQHRYQDSHYGLLRDRTLDLTVDLTYQPRPEFTLFADYTREKYRSHQRSRQRVPRSATAPANDSVNNDWESYLSDAVHTWGTGINASTFRRKLMVDTYYSLSTAIGETATRALGSAAVPGFLVTSAQDYPDTNNRFHQMTAALRVPVRSDSFFKFEYRYERYDRMDYQIDRMRPYMVPLDPSTNTSIFLGADVPRYNAHIFTVGLEYRF